MPRVVSAHRSGLDRHECPREDRDHIDKLCRPRVIGPRTRDDRDWEVAGRMPMEVIDRIQGDCDRVVDLSRAPPVTTLVAWCRSSSHRAPVLAVRGDDQPEVGLGHPMIQSALLGLFRQGAIPSKTTRFECWHAGPGTLAGLRASWARPRLARKARRMSWLSPTSGRLPLARRGSP